MTFSRCLGGYGGLLFPERIVLLAPNLARPLPAAPQASRPDPPVVCPGFGFDKLSKQVFISSPNHFSCTSCFTDAC